jgi:hypothetical protein
MSLLLIIISGDLRKLYRHKIFICLLFAIPLISLFAGVFYIGIDNIKSFTRIAQEENLWIGYYLSQFLIMPTIILIVSNISISLLFYLENKSNAWKYLLSLPVSAHIYLLSKLITSLVAVASIILLFGVGLIITAQVLPIIYAEAFNGFTDALRLLVIFTAKLIILSFSTTIFHIFLILIIRQQTLILLLSVFLPVICIYGFFKYLPYGWSVQNFWLSLKNKYEYKDWYPIIGSYELWSLGLAIFCFVFIFSQRNKLINPKLLLR